MTYTFVVEHQVAQEAAVVRGTMRPEEIGAFVGQAFGEVLEALGAQGLHPTGPPFCRYRMLDDSFEAAAGFPASGPVVPAGRVEPAVLPGGRVATTLHVGAYDELGHAYEQLMAWVAAEGLTPAGDSWESYLDGPEVPEPRTLVCVPLAGEEASPDADPRLREDTADG